MKFVREQFLELAERSPSLGRHHEQQHNQHGQLATTAQNLKRLVFQIVGHFARNALVVAQVSGSLVLLIAAGLLVRSLNNAETIDLGFDAHNILKVGIDPALQGYDQPRSEAFFRELLRRAKLLPGVQSASLAFTVPMNYSSLASGIYIEGQEP